MVGLLLYGSVNVEFSDMLGLRKDKLGASLPNVYDSCSAPGTSFWALRAKSK